MAELVSIIIPAYNLHDYIAPCLRSLQAQTHTAWEAICVDDGSTDGCGNVIRAIAAEDPRILYVRQENGGVSVARNTGLAQAKGEYVSFLDGDDMLHPQFLELMLQAIDGYDIAAADFRRVTRPDTAYPPYTLSAPVPLDTDAFYHMKGDQDANMQGKTVWGKLFRRRFAQAFSFPAGVSYSEDMHYLAKVLTLHPRICYVDLPLYDYLDRPSSVVNAAFSLKQFTCVATFDDLCGFLRDKNEPYLMGQALRNLYINLFRVRTDSVGTPYQKRVFRDCGRIGRKWLGVWLRNAAIPLKTRLLFLGFLVSEHAYEWGRIRLDPTMKEIFRAQRRKARNLSAHTEDA